MAEPPIIAIETSGRHGSVALARGADLIAERRFSTEKEHARDLIPTLDRLCRAEGRAPDTLRQCHLSIGPGSFTGLRVAVAFARHFALAAGAKICAVPTLDVIAQNGAALADPPQRLAVILDAKRGQVFGAVFEMGEGGYQSRGPAQLIEPAALLADVPKPFAVIGEGIDYHRDAIDAAGADVLDRDLWWPRAANVHRLGWRLAQQGRFTPARELVPFYLRRPEAEEVWEQRHATPLPDKRKGDASPRHRPPR